MVDRRGELVDVGPAVQLDVAVDLLRRNVRRRPEDMVGHLLESVADELELLAEPEVGQLHDAVGVDHDVLGLDVAVDDSVVVPGVVERGGDRFADEQAVLLLEVLLAREEGPEVVPVDVLHDVVPYRAVVAKLVALHYALVVDLLHGAFFCDEELHLLRVGGQLRVKNLDGDDLFERAMVGLPDRGHAAGPEVGQDFQPWKLWKPFRHSPPAFCFMPSPLHFLHGWAFIPPHSGQRSSFAPPHVGQICTVTLVSFVEERRELDRIRMPEEPDAPPDLVRVFSVVVLVTRNPALQSFSVHGISPRPGHLVQASMPVQEHLAQGLPYASSTSLSIFLSADL